MTFIKGGTMTPFQLRVVEEKKNLDDKISKLTVFIAGETYASLDDQEQGRLSSQLEYMKNYSEILGQRIAVFRKDEHAA
jgi:hypothetical protein